MYAGIDIGGSKTLVASLNNDGVIQKKIKLVTPAKYERFLEVVEAAVKSLGDVDFRAGGAGVPATIMDRLHGRAVRLGNLPWRDVPIQADLEDILRCPVVIENDAKMAALSEAMMLKAEFTRVLYVTVSTGIGFGFVADGIVNTAVGDGGGRTLLVEHRGKLVPWESFASGHAIVKTYGKMAKDITDETTWAAIARKLVPGLLELSALLQPEVIVFGGSVGRYFERYGKILRTEMGKYTTPMLPLPALREAARPEEAVIYGCYDLAKIRIGRHGALAGHGGLISGRDARTRSR